MNFETDMINIGNRRECFFDTYLINEEKSTAKLTLNKPVPKQVVMEFNEAWEGNVSYVHFFFDEGIYRMYYIAWNKEKMLAAADGDIHKKLRLCYAESCDGIVWTRTSLGITEWEGSRNNNIIFMAEWLDNFYVFKDENPNCPSSEKYKAVARVSKTGLSSYFSEDGIHFREGRIVTDKGAFDTLNVIVWDSLAGIYRGYIRSFHDIPIEGGGDYLDYIRQGKNRRVIPGFDTDPEHKHGSGVLNLGKRDIRYIESKDFVEWSEPRLLDFGDKEDIALYTNCISIYKRAPQYLIGFPTRYKERFSWDASFEVLCGKEKRQETIKKFARRMGLAITDCVFMCSRDGIRFTRYDEAYFKGGPETGNNWVYGDSYPALGFAQTPSDFPGADDELSMYCPEYRSEREVLRRYTVRADGFVSLHAGEKEETVVTKPFIFEGEKLFANMSTSACGYIEFEIEAVDGNKLKSCEMFGDSTEKPIGFDGDLAAMSGQEVVMTVRMRDADLYSIKFGK